MFARLGFSSLGQLAQVNGWCEKLFVVDEDIEQRRFSTLRILFRFYTGSVGRISDLVT
jgi:hypothetical protein